MTGRSRAARRPRAEGGKIVYAAVTTRQGVPARIDEATRFVREEGAPQAKARPGFVRGFFLVDRAAGRTITITIHRTEEQARAGGVSERLSELVGATQPATREVYEIAVEA